MFLTPMVGQTQADAVEILRKVSEAYGAATQYEVRSIVTFAEPDASFKSISSHLFYRSPDMYRWEGKTTLGAGQQDPALLAKDEFLNVFDGSTLWSYFPKLNEYSAFTDRFPEGMSPQDLSRFPGLGVFRDLVGDPSRSRRVRVLREERLAAGASSAADCFVIELADPLSTSIVWIDKKRYYVLREDENIGRDGKATASVVYSLVRLNEPLEDELFKFNPPPGARKVAPQ